MKETHVFLENQHFTYFFKTPIRKIGGKALPPISCPDVFCKRYHFSLVDDICNILLPNSSSRVYEHFKFTTNNTITRNFRISEIKQLAKSGLPASAEPLPYLGSLEILRDSSGEHALIKLSRIARDSPRLKWRARVNQTFARDSPRLKWRARVNQTFARDSPRLKWRARVNQTFISPVPRVWTPPSTWTPPI